MKPLFELKDSAQFLIISLAILTGCNSHGHEKIENEYKLQPRGQQTVSFKVPNAMRVTFSTMMSSEDRARCSSQCVKMKYVDKGGEGEAVTSPTSASIDIQPTDGDVRLTVQNLEMFPIQIKVSRSNL